MKDFILGICIGLLLFIWWMSNDSADDSTPPDGNIRTMPKPLGRVG